MVAEAPPSTLLGTHSAPRSDPYKDEFERSGRELGGKGMGREEQTLLIWTQLGENIRPGCTLNLTSAKSVVIEVLTV